MSDGYSIGVAVNWKGSVYSQATAIYLYWVSCI